ncbi:hypothetical protein CDD83_644 [Cordyceps sp. RAO-2017]|nr:hypothetical protein CDD83_644 [Cordyceps sp. RAO-2017]
MHRLVGRLNYIHRPYLKVDQDINTKFVASLCEFMVTPIHLISLLEWRPLTDMETAAIGTVWKYIADMMGIDYRAVLRRDRWKDGIDFVEDLIRWGRRYEDEHVRHTETVAKLGNALQSLHMSAYPKFARPFLRKVEGIVVGERYRRAFG